MAFIIGKKQAGKTYYYLAESARVGGKPRIVSQRYLGSAEEIAARLCERGPGEPDRTRHLAFGDLAAVWAMLERLSVAEIVDEVVGARRADAQASVGTYIALAVANRLVDPCLKLAFSKWWAKTAGDRWVRLPAAAFDHRRFWDAMDVISEERLREIERRIVTHMVEVFDVDLSGLVLDMTNFATYIDSGNDRAPIAQRGHAKQKRTDLRLVGLGLVVSTDGGIPLVSHAYPGNRPDVTQFPEMVKEFAEHIRLYADITGITAPQQHERNRPVRIAYQGVLAPDQLRELYEQRYMSTSRIAELAGCSTHVVHDALKMAGIRARPAHRGRSLAITREWLEEEYVNKQRTLADIAQELGTSRPRVTSYTKEWNIQLRRGGFVSSPLARLRPQPAMSPAVAAAFAGYDAVRQIDRIVQIPGHRSIKAAAEALGVSEATMGRHMRAVEQAAGFPLIERTTSPLRFTHQGEAFAQEAHRVLRLLDDAATKHRQTTAGRA